VKTYVLDASALVTFFEDRPGADKIEELLLKETHAKRALLMSVVNWGEVYYSILRSHGENVARAKLHEIAQLPIHVVGADMELAQLAATLKARHNLPYTECFAAALAQTRNATLVTSVTDFAHGGTALKTLLVRGGDVRCRRGAQQIANASEPCAAREPKSVNLINQQ
jgi:predicted nucleic acid-binding protein